MDQLEETPRLDGDIETPEPLTEQGLRPSEMAEEVVLESERELRLAYNLVREWSAPLPSADVLREYAEIDQEIAQAIVDDFKMRSRREDAAFDHQREMDRRWMAIQEAQSQQAIVESNDDMELRRGNQAYGKFLIPAILVFLLAVIVFSGLDGWPLVSLVGVLCLALVICVILVLLRGRMTELEGNAMHNMAGHMSGKNRENTKAAEPQQLSLPMNEDPNPTPSQHDE